MIVDTSFLLDLLEGNRAAFEKGEHLHAENVAFNIPVMTVAELFIGISSTRSDDEARQVENVIMGHQVLEMDEQIARKAGWIMGQSDLSPGDACIGATATIRDEPVLTANVRDFQRISGLSIETY